MLPVFVRVTRWYIPVRVLVWGGLSMIRLGCDRRVGMRVSAVDILL